LKFLYDAGFIDRIEQPSILSEGRRPFVYRLKLPAIQLLAQRSGQDITEIEWDKRPIPAGYPFLSHILDIADTHVRFSIAAKTHHYRLSEWLNELTLKRKGMVDRFEIVTPKGIRQNASIVPDAFFIVHADRDYRFLLEVDKGTESLKDISMKILKYRYYFQLGLYEKRYGSDKGRVLFVAHSLPRLKNLLKTCEDAGGRARYWFTLLSSLKTSDPLQSPIWYKAGASHGETFSLL
jgi:hypothetical protein